MGFVKTLIFRYTLGMPLHARGAHYFGKIAAFLKCGVDHGRLADDAYSQIQRERGSSFKSVECDSCGTTINVTARGKGEWEFREFPPRTGQERKRG